MAKGFGREYPKGRISGDDDGACQMGIASDLRNQRVIVRFFEPMEWIGLDLQSGLSLLMGLAKNLSKTFGVEIRVEVLDGNAKQD